MTDQLSQLARMAAKGRMTRREFNSRAAALGVSAAVASSVFAAAARAEEPKKGGLLRAGMQGASPPTRWTRHWPLRKCPLP